MKSSDAIGLGEYFDASVMNSRIQQVLRSICYMTHASICIIDLNMKMYTWEWHMALLLNSIKSEETYVMDNRDLPMFSDTSYVL